MSSQLTDPPVGTTEAEALARVKLWIHDQAPDLQRPQLAVWEPMAGKLVVVVKETRGS